MLLPANICFWGKVRKSNDVTMPKFEPPPFKAVKRSGDEVGVMVVRVPFGRMSVKARTLSQAQP